MILFSIFPKAKYNHIITLTLTSYILTKLKISVKRIKLPSVNYQWTTSISWVFNICQKVCEILFILLNTISQNIFWGRYLIWWKWLAMNFILTSMHLPSKNKGSGKIYGKGINMTLLNPVFSKLTWLYNTSFSCIELLKLYETLLKNTSTMNFWNIVHVL